MMTTNEITFTCSYGKDKLLQLQDILWEMYCEISDILDRYHIRYFIAYGTLLGAARHGDFIPWDDDFDICILQDDYEKALVALRKNISEKYIVHDKLTEPNEFRHEYARVRYLKSETVNTLWEINNTYKYKGIFIDLFRCWEEKKYDYQIKSNQIKSNSHCNKIKKCKTIRELIQGKRI